MTQVQDKMINYTDLNTLSKLFIEIHNYFPMKDYDISPTKKGQFAVDSKLAKRLVSSPLDLYGASKYLPGIVFEYNSLHGYIRMKDRGLGFKFIMIPCPEDDLSNFTEYLELRSKFIYERTLQNTRELLLFNFKYNVAMKLHFNIGDIVDEGANSYFIVSHNELKLEFKITSEYNINSINKNLRKLLKIANRLSNAQEIANTPALGRSTLAALENTAFKDISRFQFEESDSELVIKVYEYMGFVNTKLKIYHDGYTYIKNLYDMKVDNKLHTNTFMNFPSGKGIDDVISQRNINLIKCNQANYILVALLDHYNVINIDKVDGDDIKFTKSDFTYTVKSLLPLLNNVLEFTKNKKYS